MKTRIILSLLIAMMIIVSYSFVQFSSKADQSIVKELEMIDSDLIKKDSEYKLVFFGYAGCYHFCDPRLRQIDPIYKELQKSLDIKMLFVDISNETTHDEAKRFVKEVNGEFETISPDNTGIKGLQKKFQDVYISKMPDGEYMHSGFLYLLKKYKQKYYMLKIYPEFMNTKGVINDIKKRSAQ